MTARGVRVSPWSWGLCGKCSCSAGRSSLCWCHRPDPPSPSSTEEYLSWPEAPPDSLHSHTETHNMYQQAHSVRIQDPNQSIPVQWFVELNILIWSWCTWTIQKFYVMWYYVGISSDNTISQSDITLTQWSQVWLHNKCLNITIRLYQSNVFFHTQNKGRLWTHTVTMTHKALKEKEKKRAGLTSKMG